MTNKQIEMVQSSWEKVAALDPVLVGELFYHRLFEIAPSVKPMFAHSSLKEQSRKLLSMLNYVIAKLSKLGDIIDEVKKLAVRHVKYGVKDEHYGSVGTALLWTLEQGLGIYWNEELKEAWIECYTILSNAMIDASKSEGKVAA